MLIFFFFNYWANRLYGTQAWLFRFQVLWIVNPLWYSKVNIWKIIFEVKISHAQWLRIFILFWIIFFNISLLHYCFILENGFLWYFLSFTNHFYTNSKVIYRFRLFLIWLFKNIWMNHWWIIFYCFYSSYFVYDFSLYLRIYSLLLKALIYFLKSHSFLFILLRIHSLLVIKKDHIMILLARKNHFIYYTNSNTCMNGEVNLLNCSDPFFAWYLDGIYSFQLLLLYLDFWIKIFDTTQNLPEIIYSLTSFLPYP